MCRASYDVLKFYQLFPHDNIFDFLFTIYILNDFIGKLSWIIIKPPKVYNFEIEALKTSNVFIFLVSRL